jgi:nucleotide-binding universal stress UspA family protein
MEKIVVGVDGSAGSRAALRWAWDEAKVHGAALEIVTAWQYPITTALPAFGSMPTPDDIQGEARTEMLAVVAAEGITVDGGVDVTTLVAEGTATQVLLEAAASADLLVVGSRGHGGFTGLLVGSVSQQCVSHSSVPVVVVHPR